MTLIESRPDDRPEHPVDVVERLAAVNEWDFDRAEIDEISILVSGRFANYDVAFTWLAEQESLHVSCSFDLKTPPHKRAAIGELTQLINEQLWLGHFDLWTQQDMVMFRHSLCLAGGAAASDAQCGAVVKAAVNACETYFQAFQFVLWANRGPREAIALAAFEGPEVDAGLQRCLADRDWQVRRPEVCANLREWVISALILWIPLREGRSLTGRLLSRTNGRRYRRTRRNKTIVRAYLIEVVGQFVFALNHCLY